MAKVKITGGMNPFSTKIFIDDEPLPSVRTITYSVSVDEVPTVTAEIMLNLTDIEVDALLNFYTVLNGKRYKLVEVEG